MTEITFADTTIRDGPLSLWASNMRTGHMLAVAADLDRAGFVSTETFYESAKKSVRELREDPWERLRLLARAITRTPLRAILGRFAQFDISPPAFLEIYVACLGRAGVRQARVSDEWNQQHMWARKLAACRAAGIDPVVNLIYSHSPKHTDAYYAERARQAVALKPYRICLKDPGGLLTPDRVRTLVPVILAEAGDVPVELHSHCTTGLGPLNAIEAVKLGIRTINTGIPPLANGSALPSLFNMAHNLRLLGYTPRFDEGAARAVSRTLGAIADLEGFPRGAPVEHDAEWYAHQVPGGMISNMRFQLQKLGLADKVEAVLEECGRVREEWGYPIMVTPLSQFVGTQAAFNVLAPERYAVVTDQTIFYALGYWGGQECIEAMDPDVRARILDRPRARELAAWRQPDPTPDELRRQYAASGISDEEMLMRFEVGEAEIAALREAGPPHRYDFLQADQPLVTLLAELTRRTDRQYIHLRKGDLQVTLARQDAPPAPASS